MVMAPVVSAAGPVAVPNKIKRPTPSGIQTNGAHAASANKLSPSPSMSTKKPPSAVAKQQQQTPTSAAANGVSGNGANRPNISRARRDAANQAAGRGQRSNNAGSLGSASLAADPSFPQSFEPRPSGKWHSKQAASRCASLSIFQYAYTVLFR